MNFTTAAWLKSYLNMNIELNFPDNLLTPVSSKMFMSYSFIIQKEIKCFEENIPGFFSIYWTSMEISGFKVQISMQLQRAVHTIPAKE